MTDTCFCPHPLVKPGLLLLLIGSLARSPASAQEAKVKYERDLITRMEIDERALDAKSAHDVIRRLRPQFLRERSTGAIEKPLNNDGTRNAAAQKNPVQVYVNGVRRGSTQVLRELSRDAIIDILYLNPSDATTRFGTGNESGAILVRTGIQ